MLECNIPAVCLLLQGIEVGVTSATLRFRSTGNPLLAYISRSNIYPSLGRAWLVEGI